jgi:hypothetical protein
MVMDECQALRNGGSFDVDHTFYYACTWRLPRGASLIKVPMKFGFLENQDLEMKGKKQKKDKETAEREDGGRSLGYSWARLDLYIAVTCGDISTR